MNNSWKSGFGKRVSDKLLFFVTDKLLFTEKQRKQKGIDFFEFNLKL